LLAALSTLPDTTRYPLSLGWQSSSISGGCMSCTQHTLPSGDTVSHTVLVLQLSRNGFIARLCRLCARRLRVIMSGAVA